jgi:hypothetical protein
MDSPRQTEEERLQKKLDLRSELGQNAGAPDPVDPEDAVPAALDMPPRVSNPSLVPQGKSDAPRK